MAKLGRAVGKTEGSVCDLVPLGCLSDIRAEEWRRNLTSGREGWGSESERGTRSTENFETHSQINSISKMSLDETTGSVNVDTEDRRLSLLLGGGEE